MEIDYARHYRKWHPDTDEHYEGSQTSELQDIRPHLPADRNAAILEFGSGMGLSIYALTKLGYSNVIGIDADRSQVTAARTRGLPVDLVPISGTLDWLRQRHAAFDFAYAVDVLEHIPKAHVLEVVGAICSSLKPGSTFVCRVPNCNSIVGMRQRYIDWTHEDAFSPESLDFVLYNGGFRDIRIAAASDPPVKGLGGLARGFLRAIFRGVRRLQYFAEATGGEATMPLSSNLIAVCRTG